MLRQSKDLQDLAIGATDGAIGDVNDLFFDDEAWAIRYLVVTTSNWWRGHDVLVAPQWITHVSWADKTVSVDLTRDALKQAPRYDAALPLEREMEIAVHKHYGRAGYLPGTAPSSRSVAPSHADG